MIVLEGYNECGIIKYGSRGKCVELLQTYLSSLGYGLTVDGIFGPNTLNAVKSFQSSKGLTVDGIVGINTWSALEDEVTKKYGKDSQLNIKNSILGTKVEAGVYRPVTTEVKPEPKPVTQRPEAITPVRAGLFGIPINYILIGAGVILLISALFLTKKKEV